MSGSRTILVVDDDARVRKALREGFEDDGFTVEEAGDAAGMLRAVRRREPDLVALDIRMPGEDGLSATARLRAVSDVPLIIISARADPVDKVLGLELGADDYICKPFHLREVLARAHALIRRREAAAARFARTPEPQDIVAFESWRLDLLRRELRGPDGAERPLTAAEFDMLKLFVTHPNQVLSRDRITAALRGCAWSPLDRTVDMQIRRRRQKIEDDPAHPRFVKTVRGAGYMFATPVRADNDAPPPQPSRAETLPAF